MQGFNFNKYENYILKDLSMVNVKKIYIIAALGLKLPFLVLDEPVDGLDFESTVFLYQELKKAAFRAAFFVFRNFSRVKLVIVRKKFRERKGDEYGIISRR